MKAPGTGRSTGGVVAAAAADAPADDELPRRAAMAVFLAFALAYFLSALLRAVTATLSPALSAQFALPARDLGLLAGGYFLGFSAMQLPLGSWLDRFGPRRISVALLALAALGCAVFALAEGFAGLMAARVLMGVGVAAGLMAPLTGYRRWFAPGLQLRANAWMLMTGSLGMLASTLPVHWLLPHLGWRGLFWVLAALVLLAMAVIARVVPRWRNAPQYIATCEMPAPAGSQKHTYAEVVAHPAFRHAVPLGMVSFGGMVAIQSLWAGPWLTRVAGATPLAAASGLFWINLAMLLTFWAWGLVLPRLAARGVSVASLVRRLQPVSFVALAALLGLGPAAGTAGAAALLALYCVFSTPSAQVQPVVALAFAPQLAGRALSAFNLMVFLGIFAVQWGIGLGADALQALGWAPAEALRGAFAAFGVLSLACWLHFARDAR